MKNIKKFDDFYKQNENVNFNNTNKLNGVLTKLEYKDDVIYYVNSNNMNIPLSNKFINEIGEDVLNGYIGVEKEWEIIEWDHLAKRSEEKYRVVGVINYR